MNSLVNLHTNLDIRHYQPPHDIVNYHPPQPDAPVEQPAPIDGLRTPNFERRIIQDLTNGFPDEMDRMHAVAHCFSQSLASPNEGFSGLVASALKTEFLRLAKLNPMDAERVLKQDEFQHSPQSEVQDLIKRATYYNKYCFSKFTYHLRGGLRSSSTISGRAFYLGVSLIFGGATTQFYDSGNQNLQRVALAGFATGGCLVSTSVLHACRKVWQGEP